MSDGVMRERRVVGGGLKPVLRMRGGKSGDLRTRGFTLIEILIVIAVIVILAGIVVAIAVGVTSGAKAKATRATFDKLDSAMSLYLKDNPEPAAGANDFVVKLQATPATNTVINGIVVGSPPVIKDGWGNAIVFYPATGNPRNLKVAYFQSAGQDGIMGNSDDVFSAGAAPQP